MADLLSFKTARTRVQPLSFEHLEMMRELDNSDDSFVQIIESDNIGDLLKTQKSILESTDKHVLRQNLNFMTMYYGIFDESTKNDNLFGVIKMNFCGREYIGTDEKYHKIHQGKGYGTEVKKALFGHWQNLGLIPHVHADPDSALFLGFCGLIHMRNKSSLKYNIINCGYKMGRLFGDRVEVYYPYVIRSEYKDHFLPPEDEMLHERIYGDLCDYLSKDSPELARVGEEALRRMALKNIMTVKESALNEALNEESGFITITLSRFPHLFDSESFSRLTLFGDILDKALKELEEDYAAESIPNDRREQYDNYVNDCTKARLLLNANLR